MLHTFPEVLRKRVAERVAREKLDGLSPAETAELDGYLEIEHVMRIAKARSRRALKSAKADCAPL